MTIDPAHAIVALVRHLYEFPYSTSIKEPAKHIDVYAVGEKYALDMLKAEAKKTFQAILKPYLEDKPSDFVDLAIDVYGSTSTSDRGLRDLIVAAANELKPTVAADDASKECLLKLFETCPQFGYDLFLATAERASSTISFVIERMLQCNNRGRKWHSTIFLKEGGRCPGDCSCGVLFSF